MKFVLNFISYYQIGMMWPSQNFLLYNGTVIIMKENEWINNLKKYVTSVPPPLWRYIQSVQIITI